MIAITATAIAYPATRSVARCVLGSTPQPIKGFQMAEPVPAGAGCASRPVIETSLACG